MRRAPVFVIALILALHLHAPAMAAVLRVPQDFPSLQDALDSSSPGDVVQLAAGTWTGAGEAVGIVPPHSIEIRGAGPGATTIDGEGVRRGLLAVSESGEPTLSIRSLTITRGLGTATDGTSGSLAPGSGGGIHASGVRLLLDQVEIEQCHAPTGRGVFVDASAITVLGGRLVAADIRTGFDTEVLVDGAVVQGGGGIVSGFSPTVRLENCIITATSGELVDTGGDLMGGDLFVRGCILIGHVGRIVTLGGELEVADTLFWDCNFGFAAFFVDVGGLARFSRIRFEKCRGGIWRGAKGAVLDDVSIIGHRAAHSLFGPSSDPSLVSATRLQVIDLALEDSNVSIFASGFGWWLDIILVDSVIANVDGGRSVFERLDSLGRFELVRSTIRQCAMSGTLFETGSGEHPSTVDGSTICGNDVEELIEGPWCRIGEPSVIASSCEVPCPADLDGSGAVAIADLLDVLAEFGLAEPCRGDVDHDGAVGFSDLLAVLGSFGVCGS